MELGWPGSGTPDVAPLCKLTVKFNYLVEALWRAAGGGGAARGAAASSPSGRLRCPVVFIIKGAGKDT